MRTILFAAAMAGAAASAGGAQAVDFRRDVLPLLSDRCFHCHGPDEHSRQAGLRLDNREAAIASGALAPGAAHESLLVERILATDDSVMPPRHAKNQLSTHDKQVLRDWIAEGAEYAEHWAFVPPVKMTPPPSAERDADANPIDRFVQAQLLREGLHLSEPAARYTLIRRLHFDLTGLPPTAAEVERFVRDKDARAYDKLVDRLLQSPHYGERMALDWLDAVRYADTNGYSIDGGRHLWLWRDWVIDAFNRNLPYDRFLVEQLAGDLLDDPTSGQLIATGMQRNNMVTHEGGTIPEENLTNYNADRVKTLGEAVLGLTLACAQCHDHKYDPISQRDYYRLFAYFNTISDRGIDGDGGVNAKPSFKAKTVIQTNELPELEAAIEQLERELANPDLYALSDWIRQQRKSLNARGQGFAVHPTQALRISTPNAGSGFEVSQGREVRITSAPHFAAYDVLVKMPAIESPVTGIRVRFLPTELLDGGLGYGNTPDAQAKRTFVLTTLSASADRAPGDQVNLHHLLVAKHVTASSWLPDYRPASVLDPRPLNGWSPTPDRGAAAHLTYTFDKPISATEVPYLTVQFNFGMPGQLVAARFEVDVITGVDDGSDLPPEVIAAVQVTDDERTGEQQALIADYFARYAMATEPTRIALANARERVQVLTAEHTTMVMAESDTPRTTHVLNRGDYSQPAEAVAPGTPDVLPAPPESAPNNRLGLALWLIEPDHPLTSRVAVNRLWKQFFGAGIVRTPADFGLQGAYPTHPELLDWLAVDFVEHGWDVKRLVRMILTSDTYRQSAAAPQELLVRDPSNELLARGPRFRLQAELIRDMALSTSGLLVDRLGGPSVKPYAPGDLWREVSHYGSTPATAQAFVQDHGEKLYRRSLYTYWKRTVPPPNLAALDAPSRETCCVDRATTNTPLQALVLLNDTQFVEAARAFSERILRAHATNQERLKWAFYETVSRPPSDDELQQLATALARQREHYAENPGAAERLLAVGESPRDSQIPAIEQAAWTQVATLLLNLSEAITRN